MGSLQCKKQFVASTDMPGIEQISPSTILPPTVEVGTAWKSIPADRPYKVIKQYGTDFYLGVSKAFLDEHFNQIGA